MEINYDLVKQRFDRDPVIILIGQSGSGKETLAKKIQATFKKLYPEKTEMFFSETGGLFRKYIPTFSDKMETVLKEAQNAGKRQPASIASSLWIHNILLQYTGGPILIDGSPRSLDEAKTMEEFFCHFLGKEMVVFFIDVTDEECKRRILARNELYKQEKREVRADCATEESINQKLSWFHTDVVPAIRYLRLTFGCEFHTIDSDQQTSPDDVYEKVMSVFC